MFEFAVVSPAGCTDPSLAIAASRAGAIGVLDLRHRSELKDALSQLQRAATLAPGRWWAATEDGQWLEALLAAAVPGLETILVEGAPADRLGPIVTAAHEGGLSVVVVATGVEQARSAEAAGADAIVAKGSEAGGRIGDEGAFVLLQRLLADVRLPVWVQGGIGVHTVAAAHTAGAAGALLDAQLLLCRESPLSTRDRTVIAAMDGSETVVLGSDLGFGFRVYSRPGTARAEQLRDHARALSAASEPQVAWSAAIRDALGDGSIDDGLLTIGQDACFAAALAARFGTVAGVIDGLRAGIEESGAALSSGNPLAESAPIAASHGTRYPIAQGPMTRVSDRAEFAASVAGAGALPFLALALMRAPEIDRLLGRTAEQLGDRPWGVGILGFVPAELRAEQLEVVRAHRPPFALIAGGRPDQAQALEADGITAYLHVPSPGLLKLYLSQGARRFVFEGRECGGHVGPRTSFVLWDTMLRVLEEELPAGDRDCHVLFAGGIHDARSAAMVAATVAPATRRGLRAGVLLGTPYLFTREATEDGAITETFQQAAIECTETVLLESGPGHATRCLRSPFVEQFEAAKRRLADAGTGSEEIRGELEQLNIGRLRIAAKGVDRAAASGDGAERPALVEVEQSAQWEQGMYMIGETATLHRELTTLADLHRDICVGSGELLDDLNDPRPAPAHRPAPPPPDVAIVGMGCILPGAPDLETFWANILDKVNAIGEIPATRWDWRRMYDPDPSAPDKVYSRWGGFVDAVAFDPIAFGIPPRSLSSIEPFQLLALITAQSALRDAGYARRPFPRDRTSVILGAGGGGADLAVGYTVRSALPSLIDDPELERELFERLPEWTEDSFAGLLMNVASGRIANRLDFGGTNYTVDAACASSLAAISLGARELQTGTSDVVLAGGVDAIQNPFSYLCFSKTHALSPRGRCRPFDATADGIAISEGFATVVLKRLSDAERDGDRIYSVIRGLGSASDGRDRSLTAPRPEGQMLALRRAYAQAGFSPSTVELVEAHGTGTVAGDGAEVKALSTVFAEHGTERQACAIGSVKSMIGHAKAAAGVAGLIKASLALHHGVLPPTIGVEEPNPAADFPHSPFYVSDEPRPWLRDGTEHPRRAGVSAFGFGGTNFHIVLEEYTGGFLAAEDAVTRWPGELLLWRGSREDISAALAGLASRLAAGSLPALPELARSLQAAAPAPAEGRSALALVVESVEDLEVKLKAAASLVAGEAARLHRSDGVHWVERPLVTAGGKLAFLFPGQGSQMLDMGRELALAFPEAREAFALADRVLGDSYPQPLSRFVFAPGVFSDADRRERRAALTDTHVAQAALGATELAVLRVLSTLGVTPAMTAGHSYGELVALAAAGGLDEDSLLALSEARGRFMRDAASSEAGAMAAVDAPPDMLGPLLGSDELVAANLNSPRQTVISGTVERIQEALAWCHEQGITARSLPVACAFHSPHVAGAQERFAEVLARTPITEPRVPVYSNTTGEAHDSRPEAIAAVLGDHLVRPVEFVQEIEAMHGDGARVFLEVGPKAVLTGLVPQILGAREHVAVAVDQPGRSGLLSLSHCLAVLATEGVPLRSDRIPSSRAPHAPAPGAAGPSAAASQWLVDGGSVRRADEPAVVPPSPRPRPQETSPMSTTTTNGAGPSASVVASAPPPAPPPVAAGGQPTSLPAAAPGPAPAPDRAAEVMGRYQNVMQQFLETQRDVMLSYLSAPRPVGSPRSVVPSAPAVPVAAPAALAPLAPATIAPARLAPPPPQPPTPPPVAPPAVPAAVAAVAAEAPPPAPAPADSEDVSVTFEQLEQQLLAVVSDRTGYPPDMLSLDGDLEGDLGIDSIKRVEIAGTLTEGLSAAQRASIDMEQLSASRTLREVIEAVLASLGTAAEPPVTAAAGSAGESHPFSQGPADTERVGRFVVQVASAPAITATRPPAGDGAVVIIGEESELAAGLAASLSAHHRSVLRLPDATALEDPEDAAALAEHLRAEHGGVKALLHLAGPAASAGGADGGLRTLFAVVQAFGPELQTAAGRGGAVVLAVTRLGGSFGVGDAPLGDPGHGAIVGFLKSLALEWPSVRVKAVDLAADAAADAAVEQVVAELGAVDGLVEVGYRDGERMRLTLAGASLPEISELPEATPLDSDSVVLITGGGRGITARVALTLAERHRCTLVLVGRTADTPEDPATAGLTDAELRGAMIEARRATGAPLTPALVEADCRRVRHGRELRDNLAALTAAGARLDYRGCDVSDDAALSELIENVYERHGRIDGVIHGAGLLADGLVADKRAQSLDLVMRTKADSARTLARTLRPEGLRFLVLFSSVSGRFGNAGQADYAAASEVLNKLAQELDRSWAARVVSINWGPWRSAGMVSPALEAEFARRGIVLIDGEVGCRMLSEELEGGAKGDVEVVIGGARGLTEVPAASPGAELALLGAAESITPTADGGIRAARRFGLLPDRYLGDHRVDGHPVLPFTVAMETMAEVASLTRPQTTVTRLREIRVFKGITIPEPDGVETTILTTPSAEPDVLEVTIAAGDSRRTSFRARVALGETPPPAGEAPAPAALAELRAFTLPIAEVYRDLLFHGPLFQGIAGIAGMDERGSTASLRGSDPGRCVAGATGRHWLLDPILLDCALQVQVVWGRLQWDVTLLPAEIGGYARFGAPGDGEAIRHEMRLRPDSHPPMCRADHWFYGADGRLIATLSDVVGVGSRSLNRLAAAVQG